MKTRNIFALAALGLLLSACSNDDEDLAWQGAEAIEIAPSIGAMQARVTGTAFDANDAISLYGWTGSADAVNADALVVNNARYTYDGTNWSTADRAFWQDKKTAHYFVGVYPQRAITDLTANEFTYTGKEDLMIANNTQGVTYGNAVALNFKHALAKLKMTYKFTNEFSTPPVVEKITVKSKHTASVNYLTNVFTPTGEASERATTLVNNAFETILIPQEGAVVRIYLGKLGIYEYTLGTSAPLESGKVTTINFKIGEDVISVSDVRLNPWTEKAVDGVAQDITPVIDAATHTITMSGIGSLSQEFLAQAKTPKGEMLKIVGEVNDDDIWELGHFGHAQGIGLDLSGLTAIFDAQGEKVNRLKYAAFQFTSIRNMSGIILPSFITSIPGHCFESCSNLKEIVFLGDIKDIGDEAMELYSVEPVTIDFSACTAVPIVKSNIYIGKGSTILVGNESLIEGFKNLTYIQQGNPITPIIKVKGAQ